MKILLTGTTGQVGYELVQSLRGLGEVVNINRQEMDLADLKKVREVIRTVKPTLIINPAAYTDVEKAESEPELAMRINGEAPAVMAEEARKLGATIIHYSTDYVFDGSKGLPYVEEDQTQPLNAYGASKLAGERGVQAAGASYLILRTSWIYGMRGRNFLTTVQRLARGGNELRIVNDQYGAPTWAHTIATTTAWIAKCAEKSADAQDWWRGHTGLYHLTAQGNTTWYGFAQAIMQQLPVANKPIVTPIESCELHSVAERPKYSVLNCGRWISTFGALPPWDKDLRLCMLGKCTG